jgi:hypothetical protein
MGNDPSARGLLFIHVGKCGGTFINEWLRQARVPFTQAHMWRPPVDDEQYDRYIVWVREPVVRFRSAYDFSRAVILTNTTGMTKANYHQMCQHLSTQCLAPNKVLRKVLSGHAYSEPYEQLILRFMDANQVAEALSTCSSSLATERENCELAWQLMRDPTEHINKGVGWYLYDGAFIDRHSERMFVGTLERLQDDLVRLTHWLNRSVAPSVAPTRVSPPSNRHLSNIAEANLRAYYNRSGPTFGDGYVSADYQAMRGLVKAGLLRANQYDLLW